ncbi:HET-domain-containing protein, partial [Glonium stellatum]
WLRNCIDTHPKCGAGQSSMDSVAMLPTRVIDVGPSDGSQEPRLLISNGKRAPYVSFSHRWGGSQHTYKLSHDTLLAWQQEIPLASLPRTFRDSVHVTRELQQHYLWIDSLCIIQPTPGDDSDWQKEGAMMGDIYRNSVCNIAATMAKNSHSGFLTERPGARYPLRPCKIQDNGNEDLFVLPPRPDFLEIVNNAPLNRRAWVLQERMLSPRVLHWAPEGMFWQCTKTWASEDAPDSLIYEDPDDVTGVQILTMTTHNATTWEWFRLIEDYTSRGMTNDADKLPALSGISKIIGSNTGSRYYAGLWQHPVTKRLSLMWQSDPTILTTPRRPKSYVAPSWSWASVAGAIRYSTARG